VEAIRLANGACGSPTFRLTASNRIRGRLSAPAHGSTTSCGEPTGHSTTAVCPVASREKRIGAALAGRRLKTRPHQSAKVIT